MDNVAIVVSPLGLENGTAIAEELTVKHFIPHGHKVALASIAPDQPIIRYGHTIGYATVPIEKGEWVNENNTSIPLPPDLDAIEYQTSRQLPPSKPSKDFTFLGYKNPDGSVGTKNIFAISTSVQCVAGTGAFLVQKIKKELLPHYPNVEDVVSINHTYGCGIAIDAPDAAIPIRTLHNITKNPNFGGEVMVIGLGCEKLRPEKLLSLRDGHKPEKNQVLYMQDQSHQGFMDIVDAAMEMAKVHLSKLNKRKREVCGIDQLVVGMQCGGSDSFSGLTANPVAGFAADLIVGAGGTVMFSEVTEVRDAIHLLVPRSKTKEVAGDLIAEMAWYDRYLERGGANRTANTSPGNKRGGLSNIVEKSLGSVSKSGTVPISAVVKPGERATTKGLNFVATPASDFVCGTLQLAAGMNIHLFMTGRGTPYGLSMVPVIKISSNTSLKNKWYDLIDFDAGQLLNKDTSIEKLGWELFYYILEVASGKKKVACDVLGIHNELVLFNPGPLT